MGLDENVVVNLFLFLVGFFVALIGATFKNNFQIVSAGFLVIVLAFCGMLLNIYFKINTDNKRDI